MAQERSRTQCWLRRTAVAASLMAAVSASAFGAETPLAAAQKAIKSGKPEFAVNTLTAALSGAGLKGGDVARAYYLRGLAHSKAGHQAAAIADLNHALWLKGLSEPERADATATKAKLYHDAGLAASAPDAAPAERSAKAAPAKAEAVAETAEVPPNPAEYPVNVEAAVAEKSTWGTKSGGTKAAANKTASRKKKPAAAPQMVEQTAVEASAAPEDLPWKDAPAPAAQKTVAVADDNPVNSVLGNLFGGTPAPEPATAAVTKPAPEPAPSEQVVSADPAPKPQAKPGKMTAKSGLFVQVASLRSPKEADDLAARLTSEHADVTTRVIPMVLGNMGTFYAVQAGPVANAAAGEGLCKKLRGNGVDCFIATP